MCVRDLLWLISENMKFFRILYFHIYNTYYKDGNYSNDIPHLTAFGLVGCSLSLLATTGIVFMNYQLTGQRMNTELTIGIVTIGVLIILFGTLYQRKYESIYEEIKGTTWDNTLTKAFSWLVTIIGFLTVGVYAYIFNR
jgi:heme/copper-type cytochrome/quinol oxidase subunit 2